ncbi:MAG TPA: hydroxymethylbilane synthase [Gammaproteobacteria bacterium]
MKLRLGTRGSDLARTQSEGVAARLRGAGHDVELVVIRTEGDRSQAPSFGSIGAQGVFVREIEQALLARAIDLAVHSFKDLPTASPAGLVIAAVPPREDPADVLIVGRDAYDPSGTEGLPVAAGARIGTSSMRRTVWLEQLRPDLTVQPLRGNVPTRIGKLKTGHYDAIVLAAAGLARLSAPGGVLADALDGLHVARLDPRRFVPAPAQGALAVQCRADDAAVVAALAPLDDPPTRAAVSIEREALRRAEGGCNTAFGAHCVAAGDGFRVSAMLERSGKIVFAEVSGRSEHETVDRLWRIIDAERLDEPAP